MGILATLKSSKNENKREDMIKLDQKDLKILYFLKNNARMSLTDLGKAVDLSPAGITLRINKLVESGVIDRFTIKINYQILSPNSQRYEFSGSIDYSKTKDVIKVLQETRLFEHIFLVSSDTNLKGITLPLSQKDLRMLIGTIQQVGLDKFTLLPLLEAHEGSPVFDLQAEDVTTAYCPQCQDSFTGEAILSRIGTQILAFCCRECKDEFVNHYNKLLANK